MKNWTEVFGEAIPTAAEIVSKVRDAFPLSETLIVYMEDKETMVIRKNHYQADGFTLPVGDWGDYVHPLEGFKPKHIWDKGPTSYIQAVEERFRHYGVKVTRGLSSNPAEGIVYNPHAVRDINNVLAHALQRFMSEEKVRDYKVMPLSSVFGVNFAAKNKYAKSAPGADLLADLKAFVESEFNVTMGQMRANGDVQFDVIEYTGCESEDVMRAAFEDPANAHIGVLSDSEEIALHVRCYDSFIMARGKLTLFRHGYVAGLGLTGYEEMREQRILTEDGAYFLEEGRSVEGYVSRVKYDYHHAVERAKLGSLDFSEIYSECWPDYIAEKLIQLVAGAHDKQKAVAEREAYAAGKMASIKVADTMPVAIADLKAGDRFGAFVSHWYWCEVQSVEENIIHAWVINGAYKLSFDRKTGNVLPAYGTFDFDLPIVYTAEVPFKQHASYNEAISFMEEQTGLGLELVA